MNITNTQLKIIFAICIIPLRAFADFSMGFIPDTQNLSESATGGTYMSQATQFFVNNNASLKMLFVASVGDMTQDQTDATEWGRAKAATDILINAGIPATPCQGNHDAISALRQYYPTSFYQSQPYYGGFMSGAGMENAYYLFSAEGMDFILVVTEFGNKAGPQNWANSVFAAHPNRRGILVTHSGLSKAVSYPNEYFYIDSVVRQNDNVFLAVQGHLCEGNGDEYYTVTSVGGKTQHMMRVDYQCRPMIEQASVRYLTFKPAESRVYAYTYNAPTATYETTPSRQFSFAYEMVTPNGSSFVSQTVPSALLPGQSTNVSVTMKNSGSDTWSTANGHKLGSQNPQDNPNWGLTRVSLTGNVAANANATFNFNITAPTAPGIYNFQWKMVDEAGVNTGWFGPATPNVLVNVGNLEDTASGGTVSDNGVNVPVGEASSMAFDNNTNTKFLTFSTSAYLQYRYAASAKKTVLSYSVTSANDAPERDPATLVLKGSNNGSTWTTLDTRSGINFASRFEKQAFNFSNSTAYEYYRLEMTNANPSNILQVAEVELLAPGNYAPTFTSTPINNVDATTLYSYTATATDVENNTITYSAVSKPAWLNFNATTRVLSGTPAVGDIGSHPIVLRASDANGYTEQSFSIIVSSLGNDAPVISSTPPTGIIVNNVYSYTLTATDADGDVLTYTATTKPTWLNFNATTRVLSGTPTTSNIGLHLVTLSVNDGTVSTAQSFNIFVFATPVAPELVLNGSFEQGGATPTSWTLGSASSGSTASAAVGSASLRITGPGTPTTQTISNLTTNTNYNIKVKINTAGRTAGTVVFDCSDKPVVNSVVQEVQFAISSSNGGWTEYSGTWNSATETSLTLRMFGEGGTTPFSGVAYFDDVRVSSTIVPNTAPVITSVPVTTADVGVLYSYTVNGADAEGSALTYTAVTKPAWLNFNATTRVLSGTPASSDVANHSISLSVSDGDKTGVQNFTITVNPLTNASPVWTINPITGISGQDGVAYSGSLSGLATDADGDTLTYAKVSGATWLSVSSNGSLTGTPGAIDVGVNTFTVSVNDSVNASVIATLNITVNAAPDPYEDWKTSNGVINDSGDNDNDGISNLMEFALGGNPNVSDSSVRIPEVVQSGQNFEFKFDRMQSSVTYTIERSTNLVSWTPYITVNDSHGPVGQEAAVSVPSTEMSNGKLFLRLKVEN